MSVFQCWDGVSRSDDCLCDEVRVRSQRELKMMKEFVLRGNETQEDYDLRQEIGIPVVIDPEVPEGVAECWRDGSLVMATRIR